MNMDFYRFIKEKNIHFVDYPGFIDLEEEISRIEFLIKKFIECQNKLNPIKILMDARKYIKASPEIHDQLAKMTRESTGKCFDTKLAVLNAEHEMALSKNEKWFVNEANTIEWLKES